MIRIPLQVNPPGLSGVGMAALFAGAAHAPITSILIVFEMTDDYKIILPLMLSVVVSYLISSKFSPDSIYTLKLRRRGGFEHPRAQLSILDMILVTDAMTTKYQTVHPELLVTELVNIFQKLHIRSCPVLQSEHQLVGIVTELDVEKAIVNNEVDGFTVADIMSTEIISATPDENLRTVLLRITGREIYHVPVVDKTDSAKLLGVLRRSEILWAYNELVEEHQRLLAKTGVELPTDSKDTIQVEVNVQPELSRICFKKVRQIKTPAHCIIAVLRRGHHEIIPRGDTVVEPGDFLVFLTTRAHERKLRKWVADLGKKSDVR